MVLIHCCHYKEGKSNSVDTEKKEAVAGFIPTHMDGFKTGTEPRDNFWAQSFENV